jgi:hypothetical protein
MASIEVWKLILFLMVGIGLISKKYSLFKGIVPFNNTDSSSTD